MRTSELGTSVRSLRAAAVASLLASCALDSGLPDSPCSINLTVETPTAIAGTNVVVRASSLSPGFLEVSWTVDFGGTAIECSDDSGGQCAGLSIAFLPVDAGPYQVVARGSTAGTTCDSGSATINVRAPGANDGVYRAVFTPLGEGAAYAETVLIPGGAAYDLGERRLGAAVAVSGMVTSGGTPIAAQLRIKSRSNSALTEAFASVAGGYTTAVGPGSVDVDVLPADPSFAPVRLLDVELGDIAIPSGATVTGSISDPAGGGLELARVIFRDGDLPSSVGVSDGGGDFSLEVGPAAAINELAVTPPLASGLPILEGSVSFAGAADIAYSSGLVVRTHNFTATANARVTFVSDPISSAGTVTSDGQTSDLDGRVRLSVIANASGQTGPLPLVDGDYSIAVASSGATTEPPSLLRRTIGAGVNLQLAAVAAAGWRAKIVSTTGTPIEASRLSFRPRAELALLAGASRTGQSAADGAVSVELAATGAYDLQIDSGAGYGRYQFGQLVAAAAGEASDSGDIVIPPGQRVTGRVLLASGARARAHVAFFCDVCNQPDIPLAEVVTDSSGAWEISLPDPGAD